MTLLLDKPVLYFLGLPLFLFWILPTCVILYIRFIAYPLYKQSQEDLKRASAKDSQEFTYDIKHVHFN